MEERRDEDDDLADATGRAGAADAGDAGRAGETVAGGTVTGTEAADARLGARDAVGASWAAVTATRWSATTTRYRVGPPPSAASDATGEERTPTGPEAAADGADGASTGRRRLPCEPVAIGDGDPLSGAGVETVPYCCVATAGREGG